MLALPAKLVVEFFLSIMGMEAVLVIKLAECSVSARAGHKWTESFLMQSST